MENPKTTLSGYIGLAGTILAFLGASNPSKWWGQLLLQIGLALKGADSIGNITSQDGKH